MRPITPTSLSETRRNFLRQKNILTARACLLSCDQWEMYRERGHGLHATSMIALSISILGLYLVEVEKLYQLVPTKQVRNSATRYELSCEDLNNLRTKDANAYAKYTRILEAQQKLRTLFDVECTINPNDIKTRELFRAELRVVLNALRGEMIQTPGFSQTSITLDHILASADAAVSNFNWPLDLNSQDETTYRAITPADQLRAKKQKESILFHYDPALEPASALGASIIFTTKGMSATARDNFAHCACAHRSVAQNDYKQFMAEIKKQVKPSKGIGLPALPDPLFGESNNIFIRAARGITRITYSALDLVFGFLVIVKDLSVLAYQKIKNKSSSDKNATSAVSDEDQLKEDQLKLAQTAQKKYIEKYEEVYNKKLSEKLKTLKDIKTEESLVIAMQEADAEAKEDDQVIQARETVECLLQPHALKPDNAQGPDFLRASLFGNTYQLLSSISGVFEKMGIDDPKMGTAALASMGIGIAYVAILAAHGASVASAKASSAFFAEISKAKIFGAVNQGVMPLHAGASYDAIAFNAAVEGIVMGKIAYLSTTLANSIMRNQSGFATDFLNGFLNNPIESAILAAMFYAAGHLMIDYMHEQKAMGSWKIFDELTASIKIDIIAFDHLHTLYLAYKNKNPDVISANIEQEFYLRVAALMTDSIIEYVAEADRSTINRDKLVQAVLTVLNSTNDCTGTLSQKIKDALPTDSNLSIISDALKKQFPNLSNNCMTAKNPLALAVFQKISEQKTFLLALYEAERIKKAMGDTSELITPNEIIAAAAVERVKNLINVSPKTIQPSSPVISLLKGLSKTLLGTVIRFPHAIIGLIIGAPTRFIAKRLDVSHKTMRRIEFILGYDNLMGLVEGGARLLMLPFRTSGNVMRVPVVAAIRTVANPLVENNTLEANIIGNGIGAVTELSGVVRAATTKRPDTISWYSTSMEKVELKTPPQVVDTRSEE